MGVRVPLPPHCLTHKLRIMIDYDIVVVTDFNQKCIVPKRKEDGHNLGSLVIQDVSSNYYNRFAEYCNGNGKLMVIKLVLVHQKYAGNGIATALIQKALEIYKDYNFVLLVCPCAHMAMNVDQLQEFYSKFGFVRTGELQRTMVRKAR